MMFEVTLSNLTIMKIELPTFLSILFSCLLVHSKIIPVKTNSMYLTEQSQKQILKYQVASK